MSGEFENSVVLITGTRTGLGRSLAEHYLRLGAQVFGCSRTAGELQHERFTELLVDVANESDVKQMFQKVRKQAGGLDALINNAGVFAAGPSLLTSSATVQNTLNTNVLGTFLCGREAVPLMQKRGGGRIVNLSSISVPLAPAGVGIYSASKAAVEQLTRVAAKELAPFKITVNAVGCPPIEQTGMAESLPEKALRETLEQTSIKRMVTPVEVAHAIDFFLAKASAAVTGQTLHLGGY